MPYTHDNTLSSLLAGGEDTKWKNFTSWIKSEASKRSEELRFLPTRPLLAVAPSLRGGGGEGGAVDQGAERSSSPPALAGEAAPPMLVNSCISQHNSKRVSLAGIKFEIFPRSVRVIRPFVGLSSSRGGKRSAVDGFSDSSRRRLRRVASEAGHLLVSQFCLTYHESRPDGNAAKADLNKWLTWLRRRVEGIQYLWVLEFQERGVPHFHIFLSIRPDDIGFQFEMANRWNKITHETPEHLKFHSNPKNWISWDMGGGSYVCKYLDKEKQKHVPENFGWVGRFWGSSRALMPEPYTIDVYDMRQLCLQDKYTGRQKVDIKDALDVHVSRETSISHTHVSSKAPPKDRDVIARIIRTLGNFRHSRSRRYGKKYTHLSHTKTSRWVQDGAAVIWKFINYEMEQVRLV